ncbi:MAG: hypothetical protein GC150_05675 [Rhizobiales bacterium]|nr:hypothetical protein [Hyphomicrobiales bacterium]
MSRDLQSSEKPDFVARYGAGAACEKCGNKDVTIRIWEGYASPAKNVGGDLGPDNVVGAIVICENCGHGQTVSRAEMRGKSKAA